MSRSADDLDRLPLARERGRNLLHARVLRARIGVDLGKELHLLLEGLGAERILVRVEMRVGAGGALRDDAGVTGLHGLNGLARALQRGFRKLGGMGIARRLARDAAQAETLVGVEARRLEAAIVEAQRFGLAKLHEEFAVIRAIERIGDEIADAAAVKPGAGEEEIVGG